ncbi:MAG: tetratricopeptide repeat protein [Planctomycetota bacterium]
MFKRSMSTCVAVAMVAMAAVCAAPGPVRAFESGDWVVTVNENVPVMAEKNRLFVLAKNTELMAGQSQDDWVAVTVMQEGKEIGGWVKREHLGPLGYQSELHRQAAALASVPAEKRYIAFSLNAARGRIESPSIESPSIESPSLLGAVAQALLSGDRSRADRPREISPEVACLGGMTSVRGLVVDPDTGDAIVVGQHRPGRQRLTLDDLVVALRARFVHAEWPVVSIDPPAWLRDESSRRGSTVHHQVRFEGGVGGSGFGYTLFDADYLLKKISLGFEPAGVPGVRSNWEVWLEESRSDRRQSTQISSRAWFFPILAATPTRKNVAAYRGLEVGVFSEVMAAKIDGQPVADLTTLKGHTGERFAAMVREHYQALAALHPSFRRMEQLNELVALSRAIEVMEQRPDLAWWLDQYPVARVAIPEQVEELSRSQQIPSGSRSYTRTVTSSGGVELRAMALRLEAGDVSALADAALTTRPAADTLTWGFIVDDWVIPIPPELDIARGAEVTPQLVYAQFLARQGNYQEALARLDKILVIEPNYLDALLFKGTLLSDKLDRKKEAIQCFDVVLKKTPDSVDALAGRGLARAKTRNFSRARQDFDRALEINSRHVGALAYRGLCREQQRDYEGALSDLDEALRLDPTIAIAYVWRGNIRRRQGEQDKALNDFEEAIRRDESLAWAHACRGDLQRSRGEWDKALTDLSEAIRLDSAKLEYYKARAEVFAAKGNLSKAIADYSAFLDRNPDHAETRWQRSEAYRQTRQFDKALADCEKLNLLLLVEVAAERASLQDGNKTVGTVSRGNELQILRTNGKWLWVETLLSTGEPLRGWIDQQHVRAPQPFDDNSPAPPAPPTPPVPPAPRA